MPGFVAPLDKRFFPIPGATAHPPPTHPEDSVAWEKQLPADQKHRSFPESLWFPCLSATREQHSRPLIPSQLPGRISPLASSTQRLNSQLSRGTAALSSPLDANVRKAGRIVPNLLDLRYTVNTTGTCPVCGSFSER